MRSAAIPTHRSVSAANCSGKLEALIRRQFVRAEIELMQMMEGRFVARTRRVERSKAGGQDLDAVELCASFVTRAIELLLDAIDCCIRCHSGPAHSSGIKAIAGRWFLFSNN